jgi:hypothetical protein
MNPLETLLPDSEIHSSWDGALDGTPIRETIHRALWRIALGLAPNGTTIRAILLSLGLANFPNGDYARPMRFTDAGRAYFLAMVATGWPQGRDENGYKTA